MELKAITTTIPLLALALPGQAAQSSPHTEVPLIQLTPHTLLIIVLVALFVGLYVGVRINRPPRY